MTVKYNLDVSTSRPWTLFKLLFRWRGSVWKSVTFELAVWLLLYSVIAIIYRKVLSQNQIREFEKFAYFLDGKLSYIPIDFMLGFFVTSVLNRWLTFFNNIGYIDNIALMTAAYVRGDDERSRKMRRNIVRYCVLSQTLVFRDISMRVRKRFPTLDAVVAAGFMMPHEKAKFDEIQYRYDRNWMPFQWALAVCDDARQQQKIASDRLLEKVGEEIKRFRSNMLTLYTFDWVPLPIMYPQFVVLAVHLYFLVCVVSRQHIISAEAPNKSILDVYFPFMTVLQFIFYMGWLKVAEAILNPFGEDDDDFECNFLLDKNLTIGLTIVDQGYNQPPAIKKDPFWGKSIEPLYTEQSVIHERRMSGITGSTAHVKMYEEGKIQMMPLSHDTDESWHPLEYILKTTPWNKLISRSQSMASNFHSDGISNATNVPNMDPNTHSKQQRNLDGEPNHSPCWVQSTGISQDSVVISGESHHVLEDVTEENEDTVHSRKLNLSNHPPIPFMFSTESKISEDIASKMPENPNKDNSNGTS